MRTKKSAILEAGHETAMGLHKAGVMDQVNLREFDRLCLPPVEPLAPMQIKQIREASWGAPSDNCCAAEPVFPTVQSLNPVNALESAEPHLQASRQPAAKTE